jgi:hypothetical protein
MQQPGANDLIGRPIFWAAAVFTLVGLVAALVFEAERGWLGLGVLVMWTAFSLANAIRARRVHSIVSTPVYFAAAAALAGSATGRLDVHMWMIWVLAAGMIAANVSERVFGKYA